MHGRSSTRSSSTAAPGRSATGRSSFSPSRMRSASAPASPARKCCRHIQALRSAPSQAMDPRALSAPESLPSPRGAHLEMVGAVLAGDGLERIAEMATRQARAPDCGIVPRRGARVEAWEQFESYVRSILAEGGPDPPADVFAEVAIVSGGQELGAVLM